MQTVTHRPLSTLASVNYDPTRTTAIRARFVSSVNRRWAELLRDMRISIVDNDVFGIEEMVRMGGPVIMAPLRPKQFAFDLSPKKLEKFMAWLEEQEAAGILQLIQRPGARISELGLYGIRVPWSNVWIDTAYAQGIRQSRAELRKLDPTIPSLDSIPGGVSAVMNQPIHADRLAEAYARTYEDLKSVTSVTNAQMRRQIAEGLRTGITRGIAEGRNPRVIARQLFKNTADRINKIGKVRCRMIARTEVIRAHHLANVAEMRIAEVEGVRVRAEWVTAGNPCPICADLASRQTPYTLDEIEPLLPAHVNCRCTIVPVVMGAERSAA